MEDDYYIEITPHYDPNARLWADLLNAAEGGDSFALHDKVEAETLARVLQAEAEEKLRATHPEVKKFPQYSAVRLPF